MSKKNKDGLLTAVLTDYKNVFNIEDSKLKDYKRQESSVEFSDIVFFYPKGDSGEIPARTKISPRNMMYSLSLIISLVLIDVEGFDDSYYIIDPQSDLNFLIKDKIKQNQNFITQIEEGKSIDKSGFSAPDSPDFDKEWIDLMEILKKCLEIDVDERPDLLQLAGALCNTIKSLNKDSPYIKGDKCSAYNHVQAEKYLTKSSETIDKLDADSLADLKNMISQYDGKYQQDSLKETSPETGEKPEEKLKEKLKKKKAQNKGRKRKNEKSGKKILIKKRTKSSPSESDKNKGSSIIVPFNGKLQTINHNDDVDEDEDEGNINSEEGHVSNAVNDFNLSHASHNTHQKIKKDLNDKIFQSTAEVNIKPADPGFDLDFDPGDEYEAKDSENDYGEEEADTLDNSSRQLDLNAKILR